MSVPQMAATHPLLWKLAISFPDAPSRVTRRYRREKTASLRQLTEQRLRLLQIERIEAFGEPIIDRSEKVTSLL
jgi:hypothetical protein